jgi:hypothetical protein
MPNGSWDLLQKSLTRAYTSGPSAAELANAKDARENPRFHAMTPDEIRANAARDAANPPVQQPSGMTIAQAQAAPVTQVPLVRTPPAAVPIAPIAPIQATPVQPLPLDRPAQQQPLGSVNPPAQPEDTLLAALQARFGGGVK